VLLSSRAFCNFSGNNRDNDHTEKIVIMIATLLVFPSGGICGQVAPRALTMHVLVDRHGWA